MDSILSLSYYTGIEPLMTPDVGIKLGTLNSGCGGMACMERFPTATGYIEGLGNPFGGPTALLYEPYSRYSLYLPFVGEVDIPASYLFDARGIARGVYYEVCSDVLTGGMQYAVYTYKTGGTPGSHTSDLAYIGTYQGNCATPLPISGASFQNNIKGSLGAVGALGGLAVGGAAIASGGLSMAALGMVGAGASGLATSVLQQNAGASVQRCGNFSSAYGMMGSKHPAVIADHTNAMIASKNIKGYVDGQYATVDKFNGYLQIGEADTVDWINDYWYSKTTDVRPTVEQMDEIISELKRGVWL
jgi:hypothetical protein